MAEYNIKLTEEEFQEILFSLYLSLGCCCEDYEEKPVIESIEKLKKQSTADVVEVVHGEWMKCKRIQGVKYFMCSLCGKMEKNEHNFCPNCGADMRGEKNEK